MPGVEGFEIQDDRHWTAKVKVPLGLGGAADDDSMEKVEEREPEYARLNAKGQGVGAMMNMVTQFNLAAEGDGDEDGLGGRRLDRRPGRLDGPARAPADREPAGRKRAQRAGGAGRGGEGRRRSPAGTAGAPAPSTDVTPETDPEVKDAGPPAEGAADPEGSSGAQEGLNPSAPESYSSDPEGPTTLHRGTLTGASAPRPPVSLGVEVHEATSAVAGVFLSRLVERGLRRTRMDGWATSARKLEGLPAPELRVAGEGHEVQLLELEGALVQVTLGGGHAWATAAGDDDERVDAAFAGCARCSRRRIPTSSHDVTVTFWTYGPHGPMPSWRSIAVPSWDEIRDNYAAGTREQLDGLMRGFQPAHGGQLILWHGLGRHRQDVRRCARSPGSGATGATCTTSSTRTRSSASTPTT